MPPLRAATRISPHPQQEKEVRSHYAPALEPHCGVADIGLCGDAEEARVVLAQQAMGGPREEAFEVGEEGGVVKGPLGSGLEVPVVLSWWGQDEPDDCRSCLQTTVATQNNTPLPLYTHTNLTRTTPGGAGCG